jgi:hypothetical protein
VSTFMFLSSKSDNANASLNISRKGTLLTFFIPRRQVSKPVNTLLPLDPYPKSMVISSRGLSL